MSEQIERLEAAWRMDSTIAGSGLARIARTRARLRRVPALECVECGLGLGAHAGAPQRTAVVRWCGRGPIPTRDDLDGESRGWTLRRDVDDELVAFCGDCDRREFGDA